MSELFVCFQLPQIWGGGVRFIGRLETSLNEQVVPLGELLEKNGFVFPTLPGGEITITRRQLAELARKVGATKVVLVPVYCGGVEAPLGEVTLEGEWIPYI